MPLTLDAIRNHNHCWSQRHKIVFVQHKIWSVGDSGGDDVPQMGLRHCEGAQLLEQNLFWIFRECMDLATFVRCLWFDLMYFRIQRSHHFDYEVVSMGNWRRGAKAAIKKKQESWFLTWCLFDQVPGDYFNGEEIEKTEVYPGFHALFYFQMKNSLVHF